MDLVIDSLRVARSREDLALADGETFLGGGTWLYSQPEHHLTSPNSESAASASAEDSRVRGLVDVTALGWAPLTVTDAGLSLAATCTIAELTRVRPDQHPEWPAVRLFQQCADALLASWKVWNVATVGGNVCLSLPAGAMIALAATLDADAVTWLPGGGERRLPVAELVTGPGRNTLARGEVLRSIELPRHALEARTASRQIALSPLGRSGALVAGRLGTDGFTTIAVTASTPAPVVLRFPAVPSAAAVREAVTGIETWFDDVHGAADWRAQVTAVLAEEVRAELAAHAPESTPMTPNHRPTQDGGAR